MKWTLSGHGVPQVTHSMAEREGFECSLLPSNHEFFMQNVHLNASFPIWGGF